MIRACIWAEKSVGNIVFIKGLGRRLKEWGWLVNRYHAEPLTPPGVGRTDIVIGQSNIPQGPRGAVYGDSLIQGIEGKKKTSEQTSAVLLISREAKVDRFVHGTSVPCRAEGIFDHSFRLASKGNLSSS